MLNIRWHEYLKFAIILISLHSLLLGITMLFFPLSFTEFFGFKSTETFFWQSQSGIFLIVLAIAYFLAYKELDRSRVLVHFIVLSKVLAVVFLMVHFVFLKAPYSIGLAAAGDALMGLCVLFLNIKAPLETKK